MLEDIAVLITGERYREETLKAGGRQAGVLGRAEKINIDKYNTTIVNGRRQKSRDHSPHYIMIKGPRLKHLLRDYDKEKLQERPSKLPAEWLFFIRCRLPKLKWRRRRIRVEMLCMQPVRCFRRYYPVVGVHHPRYWGLKDLKVDNVRSVYRGEHRSPGPLRHLWEPLQKMPVRRLLWSVIGPWWQKRDLGLHANDIMFWRFLRSMIIDPTKVARLALENLASIAVLLLTTEARSFWDSEEQEAPGNAQGWNEEYVIT